MPAAPSRAVRTRSPPSARRCSIERGEDRPGYLAEIAAKLGDAGINVDVGYVATDTRLIFVVDDPARAKDLLG